MTSLALSPSRLTRHPEMRSADRQGWGFVTLMLAVAMLFLRPSDLLQTADDWPIYQSLMVLCVAFAARPIWEQLAHRQLSRQPVTACLLVLLVAVVMSHLVHGFVWGARTSAWMATKVVVLYLAIVGLIDTPRRLLAFVHWLVLAITFMASLALLNEYGYVSLSSLESVRDLESSGAGEQVEVSRIRGTGIFHDPNDLGLVVVPGIILGLFLFFQPNLGWPRYAWLIPAGVLLVALVQTHSRGAFFAFAAAVPVYLFSRLSWKSAVWGTLIAVPVVGLVFGGRMTEFDAIHAGTGQSRLQIWSDHLQVFRQRPLLGIGEGMLVEKYGVVSHNSFLHCFAELGILGGMAFLGAFLAAAASVIPRVPRRGGAVADQPSVEISRLRDYVFTALIAYFVGLMSLSRQFVAPTFLMLGLAVATQGIAGGGWSWGWTNGFSFLARASAASVLFLIAVYLSIQLFVHR